MGNIVYNKNGDTLVRCPKGKKGCVIIPDTVKTIGLNAFSGCRGLTEITIPNSVTLVDFRAFDECRSLKSIAIPASVTSIEDGAFLGCKCLENITVSAANANYQSIDGLLYNKSGDTLICCPAGKKGVLILPDFVAKIGVQAFDGCCGLQSVILPDSVTSIENLAFFGCQGLTSVTIGKSVSSIDYSAFFSCTHLTSVTVKAEIPPKYDAVFVLDTLYVPLHSVDLYKKASPWCKFKNIVGKKSRQ